MVLKFLGKLFSSSGSGPSVDQGIDPVEYHGYTIKPLPQKESAGWRVNGEISREVDGEVKTYRLVRADINADQQSIVDMTIAKARRVIDEQGDRMFG